MKADRPHIATVGNQFSEGFPIDAVSRVRISTAIERGRADTFDPLNLLKKFNVLAVFQMPCQRGG